MNRITLTLTAAALGLVALPAFAQDFSGGYVGFQAGGLSQSSDGNETLVFDRDFDGDFDDTVTTTTPSDAFSPGFCGGAATGTANAGCRSDDEGLDAGIRLGHDWQNGAFVFGLVGELSSVDAQDSVSGFSTTPASYTFTRETNYVMGLRGRVGGAFGPYLAYATAGWAWADVDHSFSTSNVTNDFGSRNADNLDGHQWGLGVERAVGNSEWRLGLEYLRTSLDDSDYTVRVTQGSALATNPFILPPNTTGTDIRRSDQDFEFDSIRLTATWGF